MSCPIHCFCLWVRMVIGLGTWLCAKWSGGGEARGGGGPGKGRRKGRGRDGGRRERAAGGVGVGVCVGTHSTTKHRYTDAFDV